jgi:hypothetical protein
MTNHGNSLRLLGRTRRQSVRVHLDTPMLP